MQDAAFDALCDLCQVLATGPETDADGTDANEQGGGPSDGGSLLPPTVRVDLQADGAQLLDAVWAVGRAILDGDVEDKEGSAEGDDGDDEDGQLSPTLQSKVRALRLLILSLPFHPSYWKNPHVWGACHLLGHARRASATTLAAFSGAGGARLWGCQTASLPPTPQANAPAHARERRHPGTANMNRNL